MADKGKTKISLEDLGEGQVNDFSTYHLQTFDSELDFDITDSDGDSLYDVDENIEEVNLDEIPSGPVDIDAGFEEICKNKEVRYEEFARLYDYAEQLRTTNPGTTVSSEWVVKIVKDLLKYNKDAWCRAFFKEHSSDVSPMAIEVLAENGEYAAKREVRFMVIWALRKTYLKAYDKYIQPMTNIKMWPRNTRPPIEPSEITSMPGRPGKSRKKAKNEPVKKKFGKTTRKERKMTCSVCKSNGHNKKGCPTLKKNFSSNCGSQPSVQASTGTAVVAAAERLANALAAEEMSANAKLYNRRPTNAHNAPRGARRPANAHSAPRAAGRPANAALVGDVSPASASTADIRPATIVMFTTTSTSENTDRVLHGPTLISSVSINIDLGFKPNGLRWKGEVAVTQRQLQELSYKRSKAKLSTTTQAKSSTQANKNQSTTSTQETH
ncbi:hypothetical protein FXO38_32506 [Capsicum annuum]|nr:hypothetical protein FXO38_32506 [Capsicum annuum]